jgi:hypothetical protein
MDTSKWYVIPLISNSKFGASMKQNITHIGLDVDDNQYRGSAPNKATDEVLEYKCRLAEVDPEN